MKPYYSDAHVTLYHGDALTVLRSLPAESVNCCVTSPPYFGLRDYGVEGQYGLEPSPVEYVERMREVFAEVRRALAADGTLWVNVGDSYSSASGGAPTSGNVDTNGGTRLRRPRAQDFVPPKNLLGIPWRLAFALQDDGWILRNDIIWAKPNGMPESITDRLSTKHEHLFLLAKSRRYYFALDALREPVKYPLGSPQTLWNNSGSKEPDRPGQSSRQKRPDRPGKGGGTNLAPTGRQHLTPDVNGGRNPGDVWTVPTVPFPGAHFACMPPELARRAVLAGCKPGGVVLDPFSGSGTTGMVAIESLRRYVGIDLNAEYLDLSLRTRLRQASLDLGAPEATA